jgi:hypothetical protein
VFHIVHRAFSFSAKGNAIIATMGVAKMRKGRLAIPLLTSAIIWASNRKGTLRAKSSLASAARVRATKNCRSGLQSECNEEFRVLVLIPVANGAFADCQQSHEYFADTDQNEAKI